MKLLKAIDELESYVNQYSLSNERVSDSTIGWQIGHALKVIYGVCKTLEKSNPKDYKWRFNFTRTFILITKKIPRGKARAPKTVRPVEEELTEAALLGFLQKSRKALEAAANTDRKASFDHPYFGLVSRDKAFLFLEIHTEHHLKIIRDIAKK